MAAPVEIDVWQGDIAELEVDALIVSANESLFMTAGAAASVKRQGGEEIERDAVDQGPVATGSAVATRAGSLAAGYVIHAVAVGHDRVPDASRLDAAIRAALAMAAPLQLRRLAITLIGTEFGVFPVDEASRLLAANLRTAAAPIESIVVATTSAQETAAVQAALSSTAARTR